MLIVLAFMFAGILIGFLTRKKPFRYTQQTLAVLVWALLFLLGIMIGGNEQLMKGLGAIGLEAFIIATLATLGSVTAAACLWHFVRHKNK